MDDRLRDRLTALSILAKVKSTQKINTKGGLQPCDKNLVTYFYRKWYGESCESNILYLVELYQEINEICKKIVNSIIIGDKKHENIETAIIIAKKIRLSCNGLLNLTKTYATAVPNATTIECIVETIVSGSYKLLMSAIPTHRRMGILSTNFMFGSINVFDIDNSYDMKIS